MAEASILSQEAALQINVVLQQVVKKLSPDEDPKERYAAWKKTLNGMNNMIGEELYANKAQQLKDEFLKSSAM